MSFNTILVSFKRRENTDKPKQQVLNSHLYTHTPTHKAEKQNKSVIFRTKRRETTNFPQPGCFAFRFAKLICDNRRKHVKRSLTRINKKK